MDILYIFYELNFSGAEIIYVDAAPLFYEQGHNLTTLATSEMLGEYSSKFKTDWI